jgi:hypothetical protein
LLANPESSESSLYIFVDGPKNNLDKELVEQCIEIAEHIKGFKSLEVVANKSNFGLARSIRTGVSSIFNNYESIIVIEDDLVVASTALSFLNRGLDRYSSSYKVASIQLYQYPIKIELENPVFLRGADCWGWATWKNRWEKVTFDPEKLLTQLNRCRNDFNLDGSARFYEMLEDLAIKSIDSWAICWHASMYLEDTMSLYPPQSLSLNMGSDGSGTHASSVDYFSVALGISKEWLLPSKIEENMLYKKAMINFHRRMRLLSKFARIKELVHSLLLNTGIKTK